MRKKFHMVAENLIQEIETERGLIVKAQNPVLIGKHINEVVNREIKKAAIVQ